MGAGKTAIGRKVAAALGLPFIDSDHEIESVSRMTIPELFERYGEAEFRALEQRVILQAAGKRAAGAVHRRRRLHERADARRRSPASGVSVWLKADIDVLMERVSKKQNRPLLKNADPRGGARAADGRALPGLCAGRHHRADARRPQGSHRRRGHRGAQPIVSRPPTRPPRAMRHDRQRPSKPSRSELGDRAYDILIGAGLIAAPARRSQRGCPGRRRPIVTDENVAAAPSRRADGQP